MLFVSKTNLYACPAETAKLLPFANINVNAVPLFECLITPAVSPIEDVEGLRAAIIRLIENPDLRKNISNQAVTIRDKYSINNIMKMWDQILEK